jgi:Formate hydrogenlyase subunit 6/NADH:ubiquinone oxidoreductase 23 kD subunit (chain I)
MFDMLGNIMKNVFSKPATRMYPKDKREAYKNVRGQIGIDIDKCIFCGICSKKCPSSALEVNRGEKSWEIDHFKCIICGLCEEACPKKCIRTDVNYRPCASVKEKSKSVQAAKPAEEGIKPN